MALHVDDELKNNLHIKNLFVVCAPRPVQAGGLRTSEGVNVGQQRQQYTPHIRRSIRF